MTQSIVLVDLDGVCAGFDSHFWDRSVENGWEFDIDHPSKQTKRYFTDHIPNKHHRNAARKMVDDSRWFRDLPVIPGAQEGLEELWRCCELWLCSKPLDADPFCMSDKQAWVKKHFPKLADRLILTGDKSLIVGDLLLDDAPKTKWFQRAQWTPVIYTQPFNSHPESDLFDLPHFQWGDSIGDLIKIAETHAEYKLWT